MSDPGYEIVWSLTARRDVVRLPEKVATAVIEFVYGPLAERPHRTGAALKFVLEGLHGAPRGDYRIVYAIDDEARVVNVVTIDHRSDVYRRRQR